MAPALVIRRQELEHEEESEDEHQDENREVPAAHGIPAYASPPPMNRTSRKLYESDKKVAK